MATAPKIKLRDGSGNTASQVVFTTNQDNVTIEGTVDLNTVAIQVSVNGAPFTSDATLIEIDGTDFTFPSTVSYPDGFSLELGDTSFGFRAVDILGATSAVSTVQVNRVPLNTAGESLIPSGVRVRRRRNTVEILVAKPVLSPVAGIEFRGLNFYASTSPGGLTTGYFKINQKLVTSLSTVFDEELGPLDTNTVVFTPSAPRLRVRVTQEDVFQNEVALVLDRRTTIGQISDQLDLKLDHQIQTRRLQEYVTFVHNRQGGPGIINSDQFGGVDSSDPIYYVVSGVFYDYAAGEEFETPYSQEILGVPLVIDTSLKGLPRRSRLSIVLDFVAAVQAINEEVSLIPASTTRDVSCNPFASEAERLWFLVDFVHRCQSFLTLLQLDDANGDGISDAVVSSSYKQALKGALGVQSDSAVQSIIDRQFDKLAGNYQRPRLPGRPSVGQVVFYTSTRPSQDITVASGTVVSAEADVANGLPAVRFIVGGTYVLPAGDAQAFYNFATSRYELVASITAETLGENGNRSADHIKSIAQPISGLSVVNTEATVFGTNRESNGDLAARAQLAFVSVDTGTEGGYTATAAAQVGVVKTKIVKSGDPLMMRDYDPVRRKHVGGKVDVWVQGLKERTVTERFAFTFEVARDVRVQVLDAANLIFRVLDSRVTPNSPIVEVLNNISQGLGVRNASLGQDYDLTGVAILDYETFQLNSAIPQPSTNIDDIIVADYRFRSVNQFTFTNQPVRRVTSVVGESSGSLSLTQGFSLYKTDDPLLDGESTIAKNYLIINQVGGVPSGATIPVNDEEHVLVGFFEEPLRSIGVNTATVRVFNQTRTVEYDGPGTPNPDFEIIEGSQTLPAKIKRTSSSDIVSGQTLSLDYEHDENFTVTYVINDLLSQLQRTINIRRHITADVLVKQAVVNSVELETTIRLKRGAKKDKVDPAVRSEVSRELNQKLIGEGSAQSDLINAVDSTEGVDFQVIPLARMGYADGSSKIRESLSSSSARVSSLDVGGNQAFILTNSLLYPTTDRGGLPTEHKGVFQDDESMVLSTTISNVAQHPNQAFIIGASGSIIAGYSDDATLQALGFTDPEDLLEERLRRTANHVVVSLSGAGLPPDAPENHKYAVSYVIRGDKGPHDMTASQVEFLDMGNMTLTFSSADS